MPDCLRRYRIMSLIVGTMLLIFCATMVLKYGFHTAEKVESAVAMLHGIVYMVYLVTVAEVAVKLKPSAGKVVAMVASGLVPFMAFFVERRIVASLADESVAA